MEPKVLLEMVGGHGAVALRVMQRGGYRVWAECRCSDGSTEWRELRDAPESVAAALLKLAGERDEAVEVANVLRGETERLGRERDAARRLRNDLQMRLRRELEAVREEVKQARGEVKAAERGADQWRRLYDDLTSEWAKAKAELDARLEEVARGSMTIDDVADALEEAGIEAATVELVPRGRYLEISQNGSSDPLLVRLEDGDNWIFEQGFVSIQRRGDKFGAASVRLVREVTR